MNGDDIRLQAKVEAKRAEQQLAHQIGHAIIELIRDQYPQVPPLVVTAALASTMASLLVLCTKGDAEALAGTEIVYRNLRTDVIGMLARKRERDGQAEKTHS